MNSLSPENSIIDSLFRFFSIFFCGDTANAISADLAGHSPAGLAGVSLPSFSSPEFLVTGDASLLGWLLLGALERNSDKPSSPSANGTIGLQLNSSGLAEWAGLHKVDDTTVPKFGKKFDAVSILHDHAAIQAGPM